MAKARTVRHPITVFIIAVLVVIGVGVGVVAATQTSKVYGPSWGRFSAAFTGHVYQRRGQTSISYNGGGGSGVSFAFQSGMSLTFHDLSYSNLQGGWVGYLPHAAETVSVVKGVPMQPVVAYAKRGFPGAHVAEVEQDANGFSVVILGPQCSLGCMDIEVVSKGQVLWTVVAESSTRSFAPVVSFVDSFQPIG